MSAKFRDDEDDEVTKFKLAIVVFVVFCISMYYSYVELKYLIWGKTYKAAVVGVENTVQHGRRGRTIPMKEVTFAYIDESDEIQGGVLTTGRDTNINEDNFQVELLESTPVRMRLAGDRSWVSLLIFFGCLAALIYSFVSIVREANAPYQKYSSRR